MVANRVYCLTRNLYSGTGIPLGGSLEASVVPGGIVVEHNSSKAL